jgi:hypothetical protein
MADSPTRWESARRAWRRIPLPALLVVALLLAAGPVVLALSRDKPHARPGDTLADLARRSGCRLHEYENASVTNPPVTGRRVERTIATDGSYIGRPTPSIHATTHSLLHGRVLIQYRPGLPEPEVRTLDRLVRDDPDRVVGFENQTGMTPACRRHRLPEPAHVSPRQPRDLHALRVFRDRRRGFGNAF